MERGGFLSRLKASTAALLLLTLLCVSPSLAYNSLFGVQAGQNDSPWKQNHKQSSASLLNREASPLHSLPPGEMSAKEDGERLTVSSPSEDELHHTFYHESDPYVDDDNNSTGRMERGQARHRRPGNSASRLLDRSRAKKHEESGLARGNPRKRRSHIMSPFGNSFLSGHEGRPLPGGLKFIAVALSSVAAATVAFLLLGEKLGGSYSHTLLGEKGELEMAVLEKRMEKHDGDAMNAAAVSGSQISAKTRGSNKLLGLQLLFVILSLYILVSVFPSTSAGPVSRESTGSTDDGAKPQPPAAAGERAGGGEHGRWLSFLSESEETPADQLPRGRLLRKRLISGLHSGISFTPPVNYQRRADGSLLVIVGRAWRFTPSGPWVDGDSCIQFNYGGHRFHVYLPKDAEQVLRDLGCLEEVLKVLSQFPPRVVALNSDKPAEWMRPKRVMHWGPETYPATTLGYTALGAIACRVHLPPAVHSFFSSSHRFEAANMRIIFEGVAFVLLRMLKEGPDGFNPALLKMKEDKSEL